MTFKFPFKLLTLLFTMKLISCSEEEDGLVVADFDIALSSETVPTQVIIINNTTGASAYSWAFEGGSPASSTDESPGTITYNEPGEYTITLEASNSAETESATESFTLITNQIETYTDITLGGVDLEATTGSVFSTVSGQIFTSGDYTADNGPTIDIAFVGIAGLRFFESPNAVQDWDLTPIPGATNTSFINFISGSDIDFSVETFDNMTDYTPLVNLTITSDNESFSSGDLPKIVLFENAVGKKGAIKITDIVSGGTGSITFDVKV